MREPLDRTIKRVEREIKKDMLWATQRKISWQPRFFAIRDEKGRFVKPKRKGICGVCAIGAVCLKRQPVGKGDEVTLAAKTLRVRSDWLRHVYLGVVRVGSVGGEPPKAWALTRRLRAYGDKLNARYGHASGDYGRG